MISRILQLLFYFLFLKKESNNHVPHQVRDAGQGSINFLTLFHSENAQKIYKATPAQMKHFINRKRFAECYTSCIALLH